MNPARALAGEKGTLRRTRELAKPQYKWIVLANTTLGVLIMGYRVATAVLVVGFGRLGGLPGGRRCGLGDFRRRGKPRRRAHVRTLAVPHPGVHGRKPCQLVICNWPWRADFYSDHLVVGDLAPPRHGYYFANTPLWAGIYMLPLTAGFLVAGPISGAISDRRGAWLLSTGGMVVAALSFVWLLVLPVDFAYWRFALALLLNGIGRGLFAAPNRAGIMNSLPPNRRGVGAGMSTTFQNSAMVLSIGIFSSLLGYNPVQSLLGPAALAKLPPADAAYLHRAGSPGCPPPGFHKCPGGRVWRHCPWQHSP